LAETLTESFCERCGTRYEFEAPTRLSPVRRTRGLFGGLKNYLTSQDSLSEAMGDAMRTEEEALAAAQLDAFHESFNFCIGCRQYTCVACWNDDAGRCRSCAPIAGTDDLAERLAASVNGGGAPALETGLSGADLQHRLGLDGWPSSDLAAAPTNGSGPEWPEADRVAASTPQEAEPAAPIVEPAVDEPAPAPPLAAVARDDEITPEPEPVEEPGVETPPAAAETLPAFEEPAPEPPRRIAPISETILRFPPPPTEPVAAEEPVAAVEDSPELAARRAQLDLLGLGDPGEGPVQPERPAVLAYRSRGAAATPAELAAHAAVGDATLWEASAREVATAAAHVGVQACGQCGLSLSANARFCRRCGTRQARSA
jgi:ribosomal protein L40E